jgi:hypothetical protein
LIFGTGTRLWAWRSKGIANQFLIAILGYSWVASDDF